MSFPSDYHPPYPEAVEVVECTARDFAESHSLDTCFLVEGAWNTLDRNWFVPDEGINIVHLRNQAVVWDIPTLLHREFDELKRFHVLPPVVSPVAIPTIDEELPDGVRLYRLLSANPLTVDNEEMAYIENHKKNLIFKGITALIGKPVNIRLLACIETTLRMERHLLSIQESEALETTLDNFISRTRSETPEVSHPLTVLLRAQAVQNTPF
jgi:hypothetical protein